MSHTVRSKAVLISRTRLGWPGSWSSGGWSIAGWLGVMTCPVSLRRSGRDVSVARTRRACLAGHRGPCVSLGETPDPSGEEDRGVEVRLRLGPVAMVYRLGMAGSTGQVVLVCCRL